MVWKVVPTGATEGWSKDALLSLKRINNARHFNNKKRFNKEIRMLKDKRPDLSDQVDDIFNIKPLVKMKRSKSLLSQMMELNPQEKKFLENWKWHGK